MIEKTQEEVRRHAAAEYPNESCGLVIIVNGKERYWPCLNVADHPDHAFAIAPSDYAEGEDLGEIVAIVHSHPDSLPTPSQADMVMCEASGLEWIIVNSNPEGAGDIESFKPTGYEAPLVGRNFSHGVLDCYTLVRDYYAMHMGITLPDFERHDEWWNNGGDLYLENFAAAGCEPIKGAIEVGDIILMQVRSIAKANHAAVYIGDGLILHHVAGRMSSRDVYDGYWQEVTHMIVRHKDSQK